MWMDMHLHFHMQSLVFPRDQSWDQFCFSFTSTTLDMVCHLLSNYLHTTTSFIEKLTVPKLTSHYSWTLINSHFVSPWQINTSKTKAMTFTRAHKTEMSQYEIQALPIEKVSLFKYLGIHLSSDLP